MEDANKINSHDSLGLTARNTGNYRKYRRFNNSTSSSIRYVEDPKCYGYLRKSSGFRKGVMISEMEDGVIQSCSDYDTFQVYSNSTNYRIVDMLICKCNCPNNKEICSHLIGVALKFRNCRNYMGKLVLLNVIERHLNQLTENDPDVAINNVINQVVVKVCYFFRKLQSIPLELLIGIIFRLYQKNQDLQPTSHLKVPATIANEVNDTLPAEVTDYDIHPAVSSSNSLPVNGKATPGDRGGGEGVEDVTSGGEPVADLREAEGGVNREDDVRTNEELRLENVKCSNPWDAQQLVNYIRLSDAFKARCELLMYELTMFIDDDEIVLDRFRRIVYRIYKVRLDDVLYERLAKEKTINDKSDVYYLTNVYDVQVMDACIRRTTLIDTIMESPMIVNLYDHIQWHKYEYDFGTLYDFILDEKLNLYHKCSFIFVNESYIIKVLSPNAFNGDVQIIKVVIDAIQTLDVESFIIHLLTLYVKKKSFDFIHKYQVIINSLNRTFRPPSNITTTKGISSISPEVTTSVPLAVEASSNYLSVNGNATPGDRGEDEVVMDTTSCGIPSRIDDGFVSRQQLYHSAALSSESCVFILRLLSMLPVELVTPLFMVLFDKSVITHDFLHQMTMNFNEFKSFNPLSINFYQLCKNLKSLGIKTLEFTTEYGSNKMKDDVEMDTLNEVEEKIHLDIPVVVPPDDVKISIYEEVPIQSIHPSNEIFNTSDTIITPFDDISTTCNDNPRDVIESVRREEFGVGLEMDDVMSSIMRKQYDRIARSIKRLSEDLYNNKVHLQLELIQNADDNTYKPSTVPFISFYYDKNCIILLNNEIGFNKFDIKSICDVGKSLKNQNKIGKFGIGFKSVFIVTHTPHIFSNNFNFYFSSHNSHNNIPYLLPHYIPLHPSGSSSTCWSTSFSSTVCPADSSSNYLSPKSRATPGDRGKDEDMTSSGQQFTHDDRWNESVLGYILERLDNVNRVMFMKHYNWLGCGNEKLTFMYLPLKQEYYKNDEYLRFYNEFGNFESEGIIFLKKLKRISFYNSIHDVTTLYQNYTLKEFKVKGGGDGVTIDVIKMIMLREVNIRCDDVVSLDKRILLVSFKISVSNEEYEIYNLDNPIPIITIGIPLYDLNNCNVYNYLPIGNYGLKFMINSSFILSSNRQSLILDDIRNEFILNKTIDAYTSIISIFDNNGQIINYENDEDCNILKYFMNTLPSENDGKLIFKYTCRGIYNKLKDMEWIPTAEGMKNPSLTIYCNDEIFKTIFTNDLLMHHCQLYYVKEDLFNDVFKHYGVHIIEFNTIKLILTRLELSINEYHKYISQHLKSNLYTESHPCLADSSPPEVHPAVSCSNYLSLKSRATPGDRGGDEDMTHGAGSQCNAMKDITLFATGQDLRSYTHSYDLSYYIMDVGVLLYLLSQYDRVSELKSKIYVYDTMYNVVNLDCNVYYYVGSLDLSLIDNVECHIMHPQIMVNRHNIDGYNDGIIITLKRLGIKELSNDEYIIQILWGKLNDPNESLNIIRVLIDTEIYRNFDETMINAIKNMKLILNDDLIQLENVLFTPEFNEHYKNIRNFYNNLLNLGYPHKIPFVNMQYFHDLSSYKIENFIKFFSLNTFVNKEINENVNYYSNDLINITLFLNQLKKHHSYTLSKLMYNILTIEINTQANTMDKSFYTSRSIQITPSSCLADSSSNYLSLKSRATPRDRGGGGKDVTSSGGVLPVSDLREVEGEVNKTPCTGIIGSSMSNESVSVTPSIYFNQIRELDWCPFGDYKDGKWRFVKLSSLSGNYDNLLFLTLDPSLNDEVLRCNELDPLIGLDIVRRIITGRENEVLLEYPSLSLDNFKYLVESGKIYKLLCDFYSKLIYRNDCFDAIKRLIIVEDPCSNLLKVFNYKEVTVFPSVKSIPSLDVYNKLDPNLHNLWNSIGISDYLTVNDALSLLNDAVISMHLIKVYEIIIHLYKINEKENFKTLIWDLNIIPIVNHKKYYLLPKDYSPDYPPEVQSLSSPLAVEASSNYLSLKGDTTPGDCGNDSDVTSSGTPGGDLRDLECAVNRGTTSTCKKGNNTSDIRDLSVDIRFTSARDGIISLMSAQSVECMEKFEDGVLYLACKYTSDVWYEILIALGVVDFITKCNVRLISIDHGGFDMNMTRHLNTMIKLYVLVPLLPYIHLYLRHNDENYYNSLNWNEVDSTFRNFSILPIRCVEVQYEFNNIYSKSVLFENFIHKKYTLLTRIEVHGIDGWKDCVDGINLDCNDVKILLKSVQENISINNRMKLSLNFFDNFVRILGINGNFMSKFIFSVYKIINKLSLDDINRYSEIFCNNIKPIKCKCFKTFIHTSYGTHANTCSNNLDPFAFILLKNINNSKIDNIIIEDHSCSLPLGSNSLRLADSSSNYLSLKSIATPRDRGGSEGSDVTSSGEPESDLREAEGELNEEAATPSENEDVEVLETQLSMDVDYEIEMNDVESNSLCVEDSLAYDVFGECDVNLKKIDISNFELGDKREMYLDGVEYKIGHDQKKKGKVGYKGEEVVYDMLMEMYKNEFNEGRCDVIWHNKFLESGLCYDITVVLDGVEYYVEVKSTCSNNKSLFEISYKEWLFAQTKGKNYEIYRVFGIGTGDVKITKIVNPYHLWKNGNLGFCLTL